MKWGFGGGRHQTQGNEGGAGFPGARCSFQAALTACSVLSAQERGGRAHHQRGEDADSDGDGADPAQIPRHQQAGDDDTQEAHRQDGGGEPSEMQPDDDDGADPAGVQCGKVHVFSPFLKKRSAKGQREGGSDSFSAGGQDTIYALDARVSYPMSQGNRMKVFLY